MLIIGIAGASGSGKTSFCHHLEKSLLITPKSVLIISLDSFYYGVPEGVRAEEYNFDHPSAFNIQSLISVINDLKDGKSTQIPIYDYVNHQPKKETITVGPTDIILLEGIFVFYWPELRGLMNMRIFIETDMDNCLIRRILRDTEERGRTYLSVIEQYSKYVKPAYRAFIRDTKEHANFILPNNSDFMTALEWILVRLQHA